MTAARDHLGWPEFHAVARHYGDRRAERSGVPLVNHITEGLAVLRELNSSEDAMRAFCLHPLFQADAGLLSAGLTYAAGPARVRPVVLAMEYRRAANDWLSEVVWRDEGGCLATAGMPDPGPLPEVRDMLVADKVQNYRDFRRYHAGIHPRFSELGLYFETWLDVLGVDDLTRARLERAIEGVRPGPTAG
jgi:hypothetical protein